MSTITKTLCMFFVVMSCGRFYIDFNRLFEIYFVWFRILFTHVLCPILGYYFGIGLAMFIRKVWALGYEFVSFLKRKSLLHLVRYFRNKRILWQNKILYAQRLIRNAEIVFNCASVNTLYAKNFKKIPRILNLPALTGSLKSICKRRIIMEEQGITSLVKMDPSTFPIFVGILTRVQSWYSFEYEAECSCGEVIMGKIALNFTCFQNMYGEVYAKMREVFSEDETYELRNLEIIVSLMHEIIGVHLQQVWNLRERVYDMLQLPFVNLNEYDIWSMYNQEHIESESENEDIQDQMMSDDTYKRLEIINNMVRNEPDRTICKIILSKHQLTKDDTLIFKNPITKEFLENCDNYMVKLNANIVGKEVLEEEFRRLNIKSVAQLSQKGEEYNKYIISDWVNIPRLLSDLDKKDKGQQHRICKKIIMQLNDKWVSTFYHNSNKDCRRLIERFQRLNIESAIKIVKNMQKKLKFYNNLIGEQKVKDFIGVYEDQMMKTYTDFRDSVANINTMTTDYRNNYPEMMRNINHFSDQCNAITEKILNLLNGFEDGISYMKVFIDLMKFISFGYLITQKQNHNATNIAALVTLILPTGVGSSLVVSLSRAVIEITRYFQARDQVVQPQGLEETSFNFGTALFSSITTALTSIFTGVNPKAFGELRNNTMFLKTISDLIRSTKTIIEFFMRAISYILDFILNNVLKYYGSLPIFLKNEEFEIMIDEFIRLKTNDAFQKCGEDIVYARDVMKLRNTMMELEAQMNRNIIRDRTLTYKISPYIRIMLTALDKAYDEIPPQFKDNCNAHRIKPFMVMIYGHPRIGKSKIFQPMLVNALAKANKIIDQYQDPQHYCCFRTAGREFWDGGQGKKVIWYNDLFQGIKNENALDLAIEELAAVVDDNPYHMNMSDVKDKGRCYLTASMVVANVQKDTTNAAWLNERMWSGGDHLARRRDILVELQLNPSWCLSFDPPIMDMQKINAFIRDHPDQCFGDENNKMFPNTMYNVVFCDIRSGQPTMRKNFAEAIQEICDKSLAYFGKQEILTTRLRHNMQALWAQGMDEEHFEDTRNGITNFDIYEETADYAFACKYANIIAKTIAFGSYIIVNGSQLMVGAEILCTLEELLHFHITVGASSLMLETFNKIMSGIFCATISATLVYVNWHLLIPFYFHFMKCKIQRFCIKGIYDVIRMFRKFKIWTSDVMNQISDLYDESTMIFSRDYCADMYYKLSAHIGVAVSERMQYFIDLRERMISAYNETCASLKQRTQIIPGWSYYVAGVSLFSVTSYLLYQYFNKSDEQLQPLSHEGNMKAKKRRIVRKLTKPRAVKVADQAYDQTNTEIHRILTFAYAAVTMETEITPGTWVSCKLSGMALNVKSNIFLMPYHYWYRYNYSNEKYIAKKMKSRLVFSWSARESRQVYFDSIDVCRLPYDHLADCIFIRIKKFNCGRDISHFFLKENDSVNLIDAYLYGYRPRGPNDFTVMEKITLGQVSTISSEDTVKELRSYNITERRDVVLNEIIPTEEVCYDYCFRYTQCLTDGGDCTMALMHTDSSVPRKIMGIHTAGSPANHIGLAAPIYQEDIQEAVEFFEMDGEPVISLQIDNLYADNSSPLSTDAQTYVDQGFTVVANTATIDVNGKKRRIKVGLPSVSKIVPSLVHEAMIEDFGPCKSAPVRLGRFKKGDEIISPFQKAFNKLNNHTHCIPNIEHEAIVESCTDAILSWPTQWNRNNARLLTWDECINGYMNLKSLDMSTSSGFPHTLECTNKKKWFTFEGNRYIMTPDLMNQILKMEQDLLNKMIPIIYFVDTLKDELRPIEKVEIGKTRLFQVGNMSWTILFRKYYGWFFGHCQSSFEFGEMMSGINPNSYDWDVLARRMLAFGEKWEAAHDNGDYSDYDSTLPHQGCTGIADTANSFYQQNPLEHNKEHDIVRIGLILGSINTFHIVGDFIIMRRQGNPSGFFLTTIINNYINMYENRYVFIKTTRKRLSDYLRYVMGVYFGDDKDCTIHKDIRQQFNMLTYQKIMDDIGLKYTSASKKEIVEQLLPITEITFLKRTFNYDEKMCIWRSRLNHDVIMEIPRWSESDPTNVADQTQRFNACLLELANYSEEEFNKVRKIFQSYFVRLNTEGYLFKLQDLFTYHYCMYLMYPRHFPNVEIFYPQNIMDSTVLCDDLLNQRRQFDFKLHYASAECDLGKLLKYNATNYDVNSSIEKQYIANSLNNENEIENGEALTIAEVKVLKKRCFKCVRRTLVRLRPLVRALRIETTRIISEVCPYSGVFQLYNVCHEVLASGVINEMFDDEEEQLLPQGIGDEDVVETHIEKQGITTFQDVNEAHIVETQNNQKITGHIATEYINLGIFLNRPYIVAQRSWVSTDAMAAGMFTLEFPYVLTSIPSISSKLQNIAWWAPDIEITIRTNATSFHYGALGFHWIPQARYLNSTYKSMQAGMNSKNWFQILANSRQVLKIKVPYTHYKNKITIGKELCADGVREDLFTLFGYVTYPLASAQTGVVAPINVTIFAQFGDLRINGYTAENFTPQGIIDDDEDLTQRLPPVTNQLPSSVLQIEGVKKENRLMAYFRSKSNSTPRITNLRSRKRMTPQGADGEATARSGGLVSGALMVISDFAGKFNSIPYLNVVSAPINAIAGAGGYFAKWMGFSIAQNLEAPMPMQIRNLVQMKAEDLPMSIALCPNNGLVAKDFSYVNGFPTEMSLLNFVQSPGLIYSGTIAATNAPGDVLFQRAITPMEMYYGTTSNPKPVADGAGNAFFWGTYAMHANTFANAWRGGYHFYVNFLCTQFHSCRVVAIYTPYWQTSTMPVYTTSNFTNAISYVMDVQAGQSFHFIIPFDQQVEYLRNPHYLNGNAINTKTLTENNGYITFMLLNELSSVISLPTAIGFQVFTMPCDDFQLINFSLGGQCRGNNIYMHEQGIDDTMECDYPASSLECLKKQQPFVFGGRNGYRVEDIHHSFEITSLRQLCNLAFPITDPTGDIGFYYSPSDMFIPTLMRQSPFLMITALFRYRRGGTRITTSSESVSCSIAAYTSIIDTEIPPLLISSFTTGTNSTANPRTAVTLNYSSVYQSPLAARTPWDVIIPYYNRYKCALNYGYHTSNNSMYTAIDNILLSMTIDQTLPVKNYISISAADDYILGWILPPARFHMSGSGADNPVPRDIPLAEQQQADIEEAQRQYKHKRNEYISQLLNDGKISIKQGTDYLVFNDKDNFYEIPQLPKDLMFLKEERERYERRWTYQPPNLPGQHPGQNNRRPKRQTTIYEGEDEDESPDEEYKRIIGAVY